MKSKTDKPKHVPEIANRRLDSANGDAEMPTSDTTPLKSANAKLVKNVSDDFLSISEGVDTGDQQLPGGIDHSMIPLRVSFSTRPTELGVVGLSRAEIHGRFAGCMAECVGPKVVKYTRKADVSESNKESTQAKGGGAQSSQVILPKCKQNEVTARDKKRKEMKSLRKTENSCSSKNSALASIQSGSFFPNHQNIFLKGRVRFR